MNETAATLRRSERETRQKIEQATLRQQQHTASVTSSYGGDGLPTIISDKVEIKFPNSNEYTWFDKPVSGLDLMNHELVRDYVTEQQSLTSERNLLLGMQFNNIVVSMNESIQYSKLNVTPLMFYTVFGNEMYRRSLLFLFGMAFRTLYPELHITVEHGLHSGYFSEVEGMDNIDDSMISAVESKMKEVIAADLPISKQIVTYEVAMDYFSHTNRPFSELLIMTNNEDRIKLDKCGNYYDHHKLPLVYRTGLLKSFSLISYRHGMLLLFPPDPYSLEFSGESPLSMDYSLKEVENKPLHNQLDEQDALVRIYQESNAWGRITNMRCVGELNAHIRNKTIKHFIVMNHVLHDNKIAKIARIIHKKRQDIKLILAAGPSSSGKTTFSKKLSLQLEVLGLRPVILSVDNYYKPREEMPKDNQGNYDFEAIEALRTDLLNLHLLALFNGEEVETPIFDFIKGAPKPVGRKFIMQEGDILVMEGIHCLNDALTSRVEDNNKFKIFLAPLTQLNFDEMNFIHNTTNRLLRRIVRDYMCRGYSAHDTLDRWPSVRRAEHKYIFPYIGKANAIFNTALDYEISVLKVYAKPLLKTIQPSDSHYNRAKELLLFLNYFHALPQTHVPMDSLLREFIGGSFFEED